GKRFVLQRHLLGTGLRGGDCDQQRRGHDTKDGRKIRHPCPAIPGLSSTPFSVTPGADLLGGLPDLRWLATTSQIGAPACSFTEAQPAALWLWPRSSARPLSSLTSEIRLPTVSSGVQV